MTTPNDSDPTPSEQAQESDKETSSDPQTDDSYTGQIATLKARLRAQSAELEQAKADAKAAHAGCCTVCWTNSFEPCEATDEGAQEYKDGTGFVRCQHCYMIAGFVKCKAELEQARAEGDELQRKGEGLCQQNGNLLVENHDLKRDLATATARLAERDAQVAELVRDKERLDWLEKQVRGSGYAVELQSGVDDSPARQSHTKIRTLVGSGPNVRHYQSPPGGITLRSAIDAATSKPQP